MNKPFILFSVLLYSSLLFSQKINEQFEFKLENDQLTASDRYYTSGLFISYKKDLVGDFIFKKDTANKIVLNFMIGDEIYTPRRLSSFDINDFDRPYAGWLFGKFEIGNIKKKSATFITFETGITGKESLSGDLQVWLHDFLGFNNIITWTEQIEFKWLFNLKFRYLNEWRLNENNIFQYEILPVVGTKDIFLENSIHYFFGKFNVLKNSSRIGMIDTTSTNEFFGLASIGYTYVAHNTLVEGSLFKEDILFTTNASEHLIKLKFGGVYKHKRNTYKVIYNFNTKETPLSVSHSFATFSYSKDF